jgi:predicted nucleotidyltransferase
MGSKIRIEIPQERVAEFCRRHHIRKLSFFGSVISDRFTQDSDVDVLVEFEQGQVVGLLRLAGMEIELSEILGRRVDLRMPADLSRYFKDDVLSAAEVQYAEDCLFSA